MDAALLGLRLAVAAVLSASGLAKLADRRSEATVEAAVALGVPRSVAGSVGPVVPYVELVIAVALLAGTSARVASGAATVLFAVFTALVARTLKRGERPPCNCFGQVHDAPISMVTLARNVALLIASALVAAIGAGPGLIPATAGVVDDLDSSTLASVALLSMVGQWIFLFAMMRRLRRRPAPAAAAADDHSPRPPASAEGWPVGSRAPRFRLLSVDGREIGLDAVLAVGRPVALVFTDPSCGPCQVMGPELGDWQRNLADRLTVIAISSGTAEVNEAKATEFDLDRRFVAVQKRTEVMRAYRVSGTPAAVLVSLDGTIGSETKGGGHGVRSVIVEGLGLVARAPEWVEEFPDHTGPPEKHPGDPAPPFELEGPDDGLTSGHLLGRLSVLLYWDDTCPHCTELAPQLAAKSDDVDIAAIVASSSTTTPPFPVVGAGRDDGLTARAFGLVATPSAVLIDAQLRFASEPVIGIDAVLGLVDRAARLSRLGRDLPGRATSLTVG